MGVVLITVGVLLGIVGLIGYVWLLIEAFKTEVVQGVLCLPCVPIYNFYFAFAKLTSPYKGTIIGLWLGAGIPAVILVQMGMLLLGGGVAPR